MSNPNRRAGDAPETDPPPAKKGKAWLVPLVAAVVLASAGAAAVTQSDTLRQTVGLSVAAPDSSASDEPVEFGLFHEMTGVVVNPHGSDGRRYFMLRVGVEAEDQKTLDRFGDLTPAATDAIITLMAGRTVEELADISQRDALKDALKDQFNGLLGDDGPITRVYFTQYVLQ